MLKYVEIFSPSTLSKMFNLFRGNNLNICNELPWMPWGAVEWLKNHTHCDMRVFEWGSGGSTFFLAKKVAHVVSVEHEVAWFLYIFILLKLRKISNVTIILEKPEVQKNTTHTSIQLNQQEGNYDRYCKVIDQFPDASFDIIIIDGRARPACIVRAMSKVKIGGYIIVDDSERAIYATGLGTLWDFERNEYTGPGPHLQHAHRTSIYRKKK